MGFKGNVSLKDGKDCSPRMLHTYNSNLQNDNEQWINEKVHGILSYGEMQNKMTPRSISCLSPRKQELMMMRECQRGTLLRC